MRNTLKITMLAVLLLGFVEVVGAQEATEEPQNLNINTAWQPFTDGVMMWFGDTNQIYVFIDDNNTYDGTTNNGTTDDGEGTLRIFTGPFSDTTGDSTCDRNPIRGFGSVYFNQSLQSTIGCAISSELGYEGPGAPGTGDVFQIDGPGGTVYEVNLSSQRWKTVSYR